MSLVLVGINHRRAGLDIRERLASNPCLATEILNALKNEYTKFEAVIISTCNRFEILIWRSSHARPDIPDIINLLATKSGLDSSSLKKICYTYRKDQAIRHLFRVIIGLDSMLVGEPQIAGQVRRALDDAQKNKTAGLYLTRLIQNGLTLARKIRPAAGIEEGRFSLGAVAAQFADEIFGSLESKSFLVIGAGKMGTSALQRLIATGAKDVLLANRDKMKSTMLADSLPGTRAINFDEIDDALTKVNVVITCLSAAEPVLTFDRFERISAGRGGWPMLIIDLGVPRNVDSRIGELSWTHLYDLDALDEALGKQNDWRRSKLESQMTLINQAVEEFQDWQQQRTISPVIVSLRQKIHEIGEEELARLASKPEVFSPQQWSLVEKTVHRVVHKILHDPTKAMAQAATESRGEVYAAVLQKLFDLDVESIEDKDADVGVLSQEKSNEPIIE